MRNGPGFNRNQRITRLSRNIAHRLRNTRCGTLCSNITENPRYRIENPESGITRVLVLSPPLASAGGIQRYTTTLIRALNEELGEQSVRYVALAEPVRHNGAGTATTHNRIETEVRMAGAEGGRRVEAGLNHLHPPRVGPVARCSQGLAAAPTGSSCMASKHGARFPTRDEAPYAVPSA